MTTTRVSMFHDVPVQQRILTVAEFAGQLQKMIESGQGGLPVFTSDGRAMYPMETVVPLTASGYHECLLIKPQPHLHAEVKDMGMNCHASYFEHVNAEADRIRAACGAFA